MRRPGPQRIPRPPASSPGGPPPWLGRAPRAVTVDDVRAAVARVPDAPELVPELPAPPGVRPSAVLVPVFEEDGRARVVLTRRGSWLRSHSHQVAFPGGRVDDGETPLEAALREAWEEVALDPATVEIIGRLTPLATLSATAAIEPFVGVLPGRPVLVPNPTEVERVFDVTFDELLDPEVFREERWGVAGTERSIYFFELDGDTVWGATARMLFELLVLLTTDA